MGELVRDGVCYVPYCFFAQGGQMDERTDVRPDERMQITNCNEMYTEDN